MQKAKLNFLNFEIFPTNLFSNKVSSYDILTNWMYIVK